MLTKVLMGLLPALIRLLDAEAVRLFIEAGFDAIEDYVEDTDTPVDDAAVLPLMHTVRVALDMPDGDE